MPKVGGGAEGRLPPPPLNFNENMGEKNMKEKEQRPNERQEFMLSLLLPLSFSYLSLSLFFSLRSPLTDISLLLFHFLLSKKKKKKNKIKSFFIHVFSRIFVPRVKAEGAE